MFLSYYSPPTFTLLTLMLTFIFYASFSLSVLAKGFRPSPDQLKCNAFVEGQGLYLLGGMTGENFMLDLSVSWNTRNPVFKKIEGGPNVHGRACAMANNGEDLFVMSRGTGYVYNVKSSSWTVFQNVNFTSSRFVSSAVTDQETGFIYLPLGGETFAGGLVILSVDLKTGTVNTTDLNLCRVKTNTITEETICNKTHSIHPAALPSVVVWSGLLKSFIFQWIPYYKDVFVFTPSQATNSTNGWNTWSTTGWYPTGVTIKCGAPAYGGSKVVYIASSGQDDKEKGHLLIYDVAERTWKEGPPRSMWLQSKASAVTGDQFISWGGRDLVNQGDYINTTLVYNLKSETWTSEYIAPTPMLSTSDSTSGEKNLVKIILAVTGGLLAVILTAISVYIGLLRKWKLEDTHDSGSISSRVSSEHHYRPTWFPTRLLGRLHQGSHGTRPLSGNPHVVLIDPTTRRSVQEGALDVQLPMQHPHTIAGQDTSTNHNDKAEWESIQTYERKEEWNNGKEEHGGKEEWNGGKEELED
ncbi:MAG: hypothetical protein J3Q66DRAFT_373770 [Benniella sp.]|nr:MAG: hypothetical protein J3Q66DRAFT_373770 [Benniella sp.]